MKKVLNFSNSVILINDQPKQRQISSRGIINIVLEHHCACVALLFDAICFRSH